MFNLDPGKLLVIAVVAIILLGPDRLPQVARQVGGAWRSFNEFRHRMESEVRNTMPDLPPTSEIARLARSPSALLNHLSNMASDEEPDGSFPPPVPTDGNGTAARPTGTAGRSGDDRRGRPGAAGAAGTAAGPPARPERPGRTDPPAPTPTPARTDGPVRAPQPSGVVVPGDPTLNPYVNLGSQISLKLDALKTLARDFGEKCPYPLFPEDDGLLPLGITDNGDVIHWLRRGEPNDWKIVVNEARGPRYEEFDGDVTSFLRRMLTREIECSLLPSNFPEGAPSFEAK